MEAEDIEVFARAEAFKDIIVDPSNFIYTIPHDLDDYSNINELNQTYDVAFWSNYTDVRQSLDL